MLARVAENIYWLSRYLERAENTVRLVDVHSRMLLDLPDVADHVGWIPLISINALDEEFARNNGIASEQNVCDFMIADKDNSGSLLNAFIAIQNNLRSCRDIVPRTSYEAINSACLFVRKQVATATLNPSQRHAFLSSVQSRLLAISGEINSSMFHDEGYRFMRLGCDVERADMTSRIIDVQSAWLALGDGAGGVENVAFQQQRWLSVLHTLSAVQMYRQHVRTPINGEDTLRFLLHEVKLPRSYRFCIEHLDDTLGLFNQHEKPRAAIARLREQLLAANLAELAQQPLELHQFIDALQKSLQEVSAAIAQTYFLPPQDT